MEYERLDWDVIKISKRIKIRSVGDHRVPAIMPSGRPVWPQYWKLDELESVKASLSVGKWNAQWMQNPTAEEGSLIKREWWKTWEKDFIPPLEHVIQSYDTAFLKKETADTLLLLPGVCFILMKIVLLI